MYVFFGGGGYACARYTMQLAAAAFKYNCCFKTHVALWRNDSHTRTHNVQDEASLADFTARLRAFRPAATVLEAEIAQVRPSHAGPTMRTEAEAALRYRSNDVMAAKRAAHAVVIERERQRRRLEAADAAAAAAAAGGGGGGGCPLNTSDAGDEKRG